MLNLYIYLSVFFSRCQSFLTLIARGNHSFAILAVCRTTRSHDSFAILESYPITTRGLHPRRKHLGLGTKTQLADEPSRVRRRLSRTSSRSRVNPRLILRNVEGGFIVECRGLSSSILSRRMKCRRNRLHMNIRG